MKRWRWWVAGAVVVVAVAAVGGPFVYIHFIEGPAPKRLALPAVSTTTTQAGAAATTVSSATGVAGTYHVGSGSQVGYRVSEVLIGQSSTAVGRTARISGAVVINGSTVASGTFTADMASVTSDQSERNAQFDGRIMDVAQYPTATLMLTKPIDLGTVPAVGATATYTATGALTMHGITKTVTFPVSAERSAQGLYVLADVPITFADWDIANPSVGGFVTTSSTGTLEALLHLTTGAGNATVTRENSTSTASGGGGGPVTVPPTTVPTLVIPKG